MAGADPIIEARQTGRRYGKAWVLRDVDLLVGQGEVAGVVGPDGAGKTTLLQICAGILDPSEGRCRVLGHDVARNAKAVASQVGYMSQGFTLYDRLSVEENLRFSAQIRGVAEREYQVRRRELMLMAGLEPFSNWPAAKLSGGMRKKLSLCANLIHEPPLLILDEPGLGVDPLSRNQLWEILGRYLEQGITILVTTSYMDEAERCQRILLLHEGAALAFDTPAAVRASAGGRVYEAASTDPAASAAALADTGKYFAIRPLSDRVRFMAAESLEPEEVTSVTLPSAAHPAPSEPTLDDVFVLKTSPDGDRIRAAELPLPVRPFGIETRHVTVRFDDFVAVSGVTLRARPGEVVALLGPNGAGKTTLIRALCGLVPMASGEAIVAGHLVHGGDSGVRQSIGYMSQRFSLYPDLTIRENLRFFASAYGLSRHIAQAAIRTACELAGIEPSDVEVAGLSAATRQRVALASSILHAPSVLFLDEPTSGVDPVSRFRFWRLIRELCRGGMTIVVSTHYLDEAEYCDRLALMHRGKLIAHSSLPELRGRYGVGADSSVNDLFMAVIARHSGETSRRAERST